MRELAAAIALTVMTGSIPAHCQTVTDAPTTIASLLSSVGAVPWTHTVTKQHLCNLGGEGRMAFQKVECWREEPQTDTVMLTASNIRIIRGTPIIFDPPSKVEFPNQLIRTGTAWANCSESQSATDSKNLSVSFQRSASIAISRSITHANSEQISLSWKINDVTIGGNIQISDSATHGTVDTNSYQNTVQRAHAISTLLGPRKAFGATIETWPVSYSANFHLTATVDADLNPNNKYHKLSDVIPEDRRTFPINGTIGFVDAADARIISYDLPYDFSTCPVGAELVKVPLDPLSAVLLK